MEELRPEDSLDAEPLELCEDCGAPLHGRVCPNCSSSGYRVPTDYYDGSNPYGEAALGREKLGAVIDRTVWDQEARKLRKGAASPGARETNFLNSMLQDQRQVQIHKRVERLVTLFNVSREVQARIAAKAEVQGKRLSKDGRLSLDKAVIVAVANEFLNLHTSFREVSRCIAAVYPAIGELSDLAVDVRTADPEAVTVLVNGAERKFKKLRLGGRRGREVYRLAIPVYVFDNHANVELRNAVFLPNFADEHFNARRAEEVNQQVLTLKVDERNYKLFKLLKEARLEAGLTNGEKDVRMLLRRYSISKLPLTSLIMSELGIIGQVQNKFWAILSEKVRDGRGRSPLKLAEDALIEAANQVVFSLPDSRGRLAALLRTECSLRSSKLKSDGVVIRSELKAWKV